MIFFYQKFEIVCDVSSYNWRHKLFQIFQRTMIFFLQETTQELTSQHNVWHLFTLYDVIPLNEIRFLQIEKTKKKL